MNIKKISDEEKKSLLMHWFHYYGKMIYTLEELESYRSLLKDNLNSIENAAVFSYLHNQGPTVLLLSIRKKTVAEMFESINATLRNFSVKQVEDFDKLKKDFYMEIYKTFKNPEPAVPMDSSDIIKQVIDINSGNRKTFKK